MSAEQRASGLRQHTTVLPCKDIFSRVQLYAHAIES